MRKRRSRSLLGQEDGYAEVHSAFSLLLRIVNVATTLSFNKNKYNSMVQKMLPDRAGKVTS